MTKSNRNLFTGYSGVNCEHDIDECIVDQPCLHNSTCNNTPGNYTCNCNSTGYQGFFIFFEFDVVPILFKNTNTLTDY